MCRIRAGSRSGNMRYEIWGKILGWIGNFGLEVWSLGFLTGRKCCELWDWRGLFGLGLRDELVVIGLVCLRKWLVLWVCEIAFGEKC